MQGKCWNCGKMNEEITKINFITKSGEKFTIDKIVMDEYLEFIKTSTIKNMLKFSWRRLSVISFCRFLIPSFLRRIFGMKTSIRENMLIALIPSVKKPKDIIRLEVFIGDRVLNMDSSVINLISIFIGMGQVIHSNQYNLNEENVKDKIVIDAGANNGDFSIFAAIMGAKMVYAFEPVTSTANALEKNVKLNNLQDKITVVNKGLGDKNYSSEVFSKYAGDGGATIGSPVSKDAKPQKVEVVKLDDFLSDNEIDSVGFIKMDTEGFEEKILIGAKETIRLFKPILSFSAYHNESDKEVLPKLVKSIRKDYKIDLNTFSEEVFYCY